MFDHIILILFMKKRFTTVQPYITHHHVTVRSVGLLNKYFSNANRGLWL